MTVDQLVVWIVVGGLAGVLADVLVSGIRVGLVGAIVVGILGAFLGGWLFGVFGIALGSGFWADVFVALIGAVVLLLVLRGLRRL
ncbi:MAG TPA: GlsB/YeaQ/YmgE family stress response membrane protein [Anaerolineales bacterium]|jgi:uncharacterized membrane protein YeaQ/YmgE (transglycosylase-associated protein family)